MRRAETPKQAIDAIQQDLKAFAVTHKLDQVVVANVASTEPPFDPTDDHRTFAALNAGQIQAIMLDTPIVLGAVKEKQVKDAEVVGQFKTGETYGAVVNRGSKNLAAFNTAIKAMKADGFRDQLFKKYFADQAAVPEIPV